MQTIGGSVIHTFLDGNEVIQKARNTLIRSGAGHHVSSYIELAKKIAELQFRNSEHVLLFRGQSADYRNQKGNTSLKPSILRGADAHNPAAEILEARFERLKWAERILVEHYRSDPTFPLPERIRRQRITRWSILQHYEICDTPLLDVTHSLRVAASFASQRAGTEAYIFVLGVPHLSGAITASADAGIQIARLSSMCPPVALRPHIQEGYLLGEYPEMGDYEQKSLYEHFEVDFGLRLVAKFRFDPLAFWGDGKAFPKLSPKTLSPATHTDPFSVVAKRIKNALCTR